MKTVPVHASHTMGSSLEDIRARIDDQHFGHIMNVLSNLYSDPVMAVVREYSTNALDSHVAAGNDLPILVTLPTSTDLRFTVQDFGLGLSLDDMRNTYLSYGSSDKRESDDFNGTLGLGSKSGLTYAPLGWQVRAVKDGRRVLAVVAHDSDGVGTMRSLDEADTDEPNGVTITIPVEAGDLSAFVSAARRLFYVWKPGQVLVRFGETGTFEEPESYVNDPSLIWLDESVAVGRDIQQSMVVMGNVPYRINKRSGWGYGVIADVPMGSVHFTPSREDLHFTPHTDETIDLLMEFVDTRAEEKVLEYLKSGATPYERVCHYIEVRESLDHKMQRKLDRAMREILPLDGVSMNGKRRYAWRPGTRGSGAASDDRLFYGNVRRGSTRYGSHTGHPIVVTEFPFQAAKLSTPMKARLNRFRDWLYDNSNDYADADRSFLVLPEGLGEVEMLEGHPCVYTWADVVSVTPAPPREKNGQTRTKTLYTYWEGGVEYETEQFETGDVVVISHGSVERSHVRNWTENYPGVKRVCLKNMNQDERFARVNPGVITTTTWEVERDAKAAALATLSDYDKVRMYIMRGDADQWKSMGLVANKVDDPELAAFVRLCGDGKVSAAQTRAQMLGVHWSEAPEVLTTLVERYPLVSSIRYISKDQAEELAYYLNAKYADMKTQEGKVDVDSSTAIQ